MNTSTDMSMGMGMGNRTPAITGMDMRKCTETIMAMSMAEHIPAIIMRIPCISQS